MFDLMLFMSIILLYVLWTTIRINKKINMIGQLSALILTNLAATVVYEIPDKEIEKARDWENWDKE